MSGNVAVWMANENDLTVKVASLLLETDDVGQLSEKARVVFHCVRSSVCGADVVATLTWGSLWVDRYQLSILFVYSGAQLTFRCSLDEVIETVPSGSVKFV